MKRTVFRCRNQARGYPKNPRNLEELILVEPFTLTIDGRGFLLFDNAPYEDKILILGMK